MENRTRILEDIDSIWEMIKENDTRINDIKKSLDSKDLTKSEIDDLLNQKKSLEEDNLEHYTDISILEEMLHKIDMQEYDERAPSPYEEHYDPLEEVFTAGDY